MSESTEVEITLKDCIQYDPKKCSGAIEYRLSPDRDDLKAFPRCDVHWEERLNLAERSRELSGDVAPKWFDPEYAGEHWDEDY